MYTKNFCIDQSWSRLTGGQGGGWVLEGDGIYCLSIVMIYPALNRFS